MALPGVSIEVQNGALGQLVQSDDSLAGLILQSDVAPSGLALATPKLLTSLADAESVGITAAFDSTNTVFVHKHIKEFYDEAGTGAKLWIIIISQATLMAATVDVANAHASTLLNAANGKIRVLGVTRSPASGYTPDTSANQIDVDVVNAITKAHALAEQYAGNYKPFRVVLEGRSYTGTHGSLVDLKTQDNNRVAVLLGDTASGGNAAVGLLLGRLAANEIQENVGKVKNGSVETTADIYLGTSKLTEVETTVSTIHDNGFITFRKWVGKAGYYFTDDPTATAASDDFNSIARGRVIDKALVIAYSTFVNEILDEVAIDDNGRIATVQAKYYQSIIDNAVNGAMTANGEISSFSSQIDVEQNVLSTNQICIEARIVPVGYAKEIVVKLGFENPANA